MTARPRVPIVEQPERAFDMRSLWRLATWGTAATLALMVAVIGTYSDTGRRGASAAGNVSAAQLASRSPEAEAETRRLADAVRELTADREHLAARISTVERNLEDMTGSIRRQSAETAAPPSPAADAPDPASPAAPSKVAAVSALSEPKAAGLVGQPPPSERVAHAPSAAPDNAPEPAKPELGVDVGGATNFDGLRVLWASTKGNHGALFDGLHPIVAVRENGRTRNTELRLIAGPLPNVEAATRLCATLSAERRYCQPVGFEGQRLADADVVPERKPAAAAPKPAPKSAPTAPKLPKLFQ
jgi:hypothetical protein